jgi:phosphohistidine phosphatase
LSGILYEHRSFSTATSEQGADLLERRIGVSWISYLNFTKVSLIVHAFLVRHGNAVAEADNPKRPLSVNGRQNVHRMTHWALRRNFQISAIYHSGILRAFETAQILAEVLAPPLGLHLHAGLLPEDDPAIVKAELDLMDHPVALVGHLPHLNRLAALLTSGDPERAVVEFLPAMMVGFEKQNHQWKIACRSEEPAV